MLTLRRPGAGPLATGGALRSLRALPPLAVLAFGAVYLAAGAGFLLDDWWTLGNAELDRWWMAAGRDQWFARPGAAAVYAVEFGLLGAHPALIAAVQVGVVAVATVLLRRLLARFVDDRLAVAVALTWAVLPNHTSLEMWASTLNISLALVLTLAGLSVAVDAHTDRRRAAATALLAAGSLCYEAVIPVAAVGVVALPWLVRRRPDRRLVATAWSGLAVASLWILANWHPDKGGVSETAHPAYVLAGHFGSTLFGEGGHAALLSMVPLLGSVLIAWAVTGRASWTPHRGSAGLVAAGWVVLVLGTLPFVTYFYSPLGAGDRVTVVSGVGGAMVWVGVAFEVWCRRRVAAGALAAAALVLAVATHVDMALLYSDKAAEGRAVLRAVVEQIEDPSLPIYVGPEPPLERNVVAFLDQSNIEPALRLEYGDPRVRAYLTHDLDTFESVPEPQRFDVRDLRGPRG